MQPRQGHLTTTPNAFALIWRLSDLTSRDALAAEKRWRGSCRRDVRSSNLHLKLIKSLHVLAPSQSQLRKDTTEQSEYAESPRRRFLLPVTFIPRWVDSKKPWKSPGASLVVAFHSPTPIQFRVRFRAWGSHQMFTREAPFPDAIVTSERGAERSTELNL
jgi:hypothetical protein